ncbi:hypothetical protein ACFLZC_01180 [Patescibacteria group bacterium]
MLKRERKGFLVRLAVIISLILSFFMFFPKESLGKVGSFKTYHFGEYGWRVELDSGWDRMSVPNKEVVSVAVDSKVLIKFKHTNVGVRVVVFVKNKVVKNWSKNQIVKAVEYYVKNTRMVKRGQTFSLKTFLGESLSSFGRSYDAIDILMGTEYWSRVGKFVSFSHQGRDFAFFVYVHDEMRNYDFETLSMVIKREILNGMNFVE